MAPKKTKMLQKEWIFEHGGNAEKAKSFIHRDLTHLHCVCLSVCVSVWIFVCVYSHGRLLSENPPLIQSGLKGLLCSRCLLSSRKHKHNMSTSITVPVVLVGICMCACVCCHSSGLTRPTCVSGIWLTASWTHFQWGLKTFGQSIVRESPHRVESSIHNSWPNINQVLKPPSRQCFFLSDSQCSFSNWEWVRGE